MKQSKRATCPFCGSSTVPHCGNDGTCGWWRCVNAKCRSFGDDTRSVDARRENSR